MKLIELNIDGLVGPTHNYAGLAFGNEASQGNAGNISNPKRAALQGLQKMRLLTSFGIPQMVMPPNPRPNGKLLRSLGFTGDIRTQILQVGKQSPELLRYAYSASSMWAANAATVSPATDTSDAKTHFTPANLISTAHRSHEPAFTSRALIKLFPDEQSFSHHAPLPANPLFSDEGAANHMRVYTPGGVSQGINIFVYGRDQATVNQFTKRYPARQTRQAFEAISRRHGLRDADTFYLLQNPDAIDAGVFHNDVIATSNDALVIYHEDAFVGGDAALTPVQKAAKDALLLVKVPRAALSMKEAVKSYLFNSQLVTTSSGMVLIAPSECAEYPRVSDIIDSWIADADNPIALVHYVDLRESMRNGGGPACLRLRVPLTQQHLTNVHAGAMFTDALHSKLAAWVEAHYRDQLRPEDLLDPEFADACLRALSELEEILELKGLYES